MYTITITSIDHDTYTRLVDKACALSNLGVAEDMVSLPAVACVALLLGIEEMHPIEDLIPLLLDLGKNKR